MYPLRSGPYGLHVMYSLTKLKTEHYGDIRKRCINVSIQTGFIKHSFGVERRHSQTDCGGFVVHVTS